MKILSLEAERIRRLKAVRINLNPEDEGPVFIVGNNDEGKSTTLDSILMALCGGRIADPIRRGETQGEIRIALGDDEVDLTVRKVFKEGQAPRLIVKTADGMVGSQASLDKLVGAIGIDPVALANMDPIKQAEAVQDALGIDLGDLDRRFADVYESRRKGNVWIRDQKGTLKAFDPDLDNAPDEEVVVQDLMTDLETIAAQGEARKDGEREVTQAVDAVEAFQIRARTQAERLDSLRKSMKDAEDEYQRTQNDIKAAQDEQTAAEDRLTKVDIPADPEPIKAQIAQAETVNINVRAKKAKAALAVQIDKAEAKVLEFTNELSGIEQAKKDRIAQAGLPDGLEGIGFDDTGLTFEGFPLANLGTGKRLRVATQIAIAMNPKLKVLLIKAGNDLDRNNLRAILETAEAADAQVWIESVFKRDAYGPEVEIVDGTGEFGEAPDLETDPKMKPADDGAELTEEVKAAQAKVEKAQAETKKAAKKTDADLIREELAKRNAAQEAEDDAEPKPPAFELFN